MNINTGEIVIQARRACFNSINLFTVIFAVLMNGALRFIDTEYFWIQCLVWSFYSLYAIQLSISLSKSNTHIQKIDLNSSGEQKPGLRIVSDNNNTINIGQSLINFINAIGKNIFLFAFVVILEVFIGMSFFYLIQYLLKEHMQILDILFDRAIKDMKSSGIKDPQQLQQMLYINVFAQLHNLGIDTLKRMNYFSLCLILSFFFKLIAYTLLSWIKYAALGQIQKRQQLKKIPQQRIIQNQQPAQILIGSAQQMDNIKKMSEQTVGVLDTFNILFKKFIRWNVITAQVRLYLRLGIILLFIDILDPYFYICMGFFYVKIVQFEFMSLVQQLTFVQHNVDLKPKENAQNIQQNNTKKQQQEGHGTSEKRQYQELFKQVGVETRQQMNRQNVQNHMCQQQKLKSNLNNIQNKNQQIKNFDSIFEKLNKIGTNYQNRQKQKQNIIHKRKNKRLRLVYRPYYNDVIVVRKFSKELD